MTDALDTLEHDNLGSTVYHLLCNALIQGKLKPGERLKIRELAARLGTSVTPVRDAILRLVQEQALAMKSARDIRVPHMTVERYLEIRAIRIKLEGLAAEMAAQNADATQIALLERYLGWRGCGQGKCLLTLGVTAAPATARHALRAARKLLA